MRAISFIKSKRGLAAIAIVAVIALVLFWCCLSILNGTNSGTSQENNSYTGYYGNSYDKGVSPPVAPLYSDRSGDTLGATSYYAPMPTAVPYPYATGSDNAYTNLNDRKVIMSASVQMETQNLNKTVDSIRSIASGAGGYVQSSSTWLIDSNRREAMITVQVPSSSYEASLAAIKALGDVKSESSSGQDVTRQYVDLNASLTNLQAEEKQLSSIMGMSKNVTEVLAVEKELSRVRGQIQTTQAELNYLGSQVSFSTISATVCEPQPVVGYDWGLGTALRNAAHAFTGMIGALIILTGYLIPLVLYLVIGIVLVYALYRVAMWLYSKWMGKK